MSNLSRREILGSAALVGGWMVLGPEAAWAKGSGAGQPGGASGPYTLPPLPYGYSDLEPYIDTQTMKLHHDTHHAGYVRGANKAIAELEAVRRAGGDRIGEIRPLTRNLAFTLSGHALHTVFWSCMKKDGGGEPSGGSEIGKLIKRDFGTFAAFAAHFQAASQQVSGSGWGILAYEPLAERLIVLQAEKHENQGVWGTIPLLCVDVWEHAYYLKYQNRRSEYIKAFMEVVNWDAVEERLQYARQLD
jgi:Fe-Mn family superoxide dismutase